VVIQTTTYVQGGMLCRKCDGKGGFSAFGKSCTLDDFHFKTRCPVCNGNKTTTRQNMCGTCAGKGGNGPFGFCELTDVHRRSYCPTCNGQCYF
jgi:DnaJ-class molecular chaperone